MADETSSNTHGAGSDNASANNNAAVNDNTPANDDRAVNIALPTGLAQHIHDQVPRYIVRGAVDDAVPDAPPSPQPKPLEARQVKLTFNGSAGESVTFKLKTTTKLGKAMDHYSARVQRPVDQLRFLFEGQRLGNDDTPAAHEMEDDDIVEVHMEQIGGGAGSDADDEEDWEDWVEISVGDLLQKTLGEKERLCSEKARLCCLMDRLKKEISALKTNNRSIAKENNYLRMEKQELIDDKSTLTLHKSQLTLQMTKVMVEYQHAVKTLEKFHTCYDTEVRDLKSSLLQKDHAIDSILEDFQFKLN